MSAQKVVHAFPDAQSDFDRALDRIILELGNQRAVFEGKNSLVCALFDSWVNVFNQAKAAREKRLETIIAGLGDVGLFYLEAQYKLEAVKLDLPLDQLVKVRDTITEQLQSELGVNASLAAKDIELEKLRKELIAVNDRFTKEVVRLQTGWDSASTKVHQVGHYKELAEQALARVTAELERLKAESKDTLRLKTELREISDRAFAAESALDLRVTETTKLRGMLASATARLSQKVQVVEDTSRIQALEASLSTQTAQTEQLREQLIESEEIRRELAAEFAEQIKIATSAAADTLHHFQELITAATKSRISVSTSLNRLADITDQARQGLPQEIHTRIPDQFVDVQSDIDRVREWLESSTQLNEYLTDERTALNRQLETAREAIRLRVSTDTRSVAKIERQIKKLDDQLQDLVEKTSRVKACQSGLMAYKRAVDIVTSGIPIDRGQELPEFPEIVAEPLVVSAEYNSAGTSEERRTQLEAIAQKTGLNVNAVIVISLYDVVRTRHFKGLSNIVKAAEIIGLLEVFRLPGEHELKTNCWTDNSNAPFLDYFGKFSGLMYKRNDDPLKWNPRQLLTPDEITGFNATLSNITPQKKPGKKKKR